jgi:hypothetical protein
MWEKMRDPILQTFPIPPGISKNVASYLKKIDAIYVNDAYNSLSIEGYRVSADLIERVRSSRVSKSRFELSLFRDANFKRRLWRCRLGLRVQRIEIAHIGEDPSPRAAGGFAHDPQLVQFAQCLRHRWGRESG